MLASWPATQHLLFYCCRKYEITITTYKTPHLGLVCNLNTVLDNSKILSANPSGVSMGLCSSCLFSSVFVLARPRTLLMLSEHPAHKDQIDLAAMFVCERVMVLSMFRHESSAQRKHELAPERVPEKDQQPSRG